MLKFMFRKVITVKVSHDVAVILHKPTALGNYFGVTPKWFVKQVGESWAPYTINDDYLPQGKEVEINHGKTYGIRSASYAGGVGHQFSIGWNGALNEIKTVSGYDECLEYSYTLKGEVKNVSEAKAVRKRETGTDLSKTLCPTDFEFGPEMSPEPQVPTV